VVTNFHVIRGAQNLQVTFADQSVYDARVVGVDPDRDLAVVKVDAPKVSECHMHMHADVRVWVHWMTGKSTSHPALPSSPAARMG
jgi:S1-C subfamily serine protease